MKINKDNLIYALIGETHVVKGNSNIIYIKPKRLTKGIICDGIFHENASTTEISHMRTLELIEEKYINKYKYVYISTISEKELKKRFANSSIDIDNIMDYYFISKKDTIYYFDFEYSTGIKELSEYKFYELYNIDAKDVENQQNTTEIIDNEGIKKTPISYYTNVIKNSVIGQDDAIDTILVAIYKGMLSNELKSNILVYGPSGCGKTEIFRQIAKHMNLPIHIEDINGYTAAGYVGKDVENILAKLYINADQNLVKAERSIMVLDEIDKKASNDGQKSQVNKEDVLNALLKIIEGGVYDIKVNNKTIDFDTSRLIVVAVGAFSKFFEKKSLGFNNSMSCSKNKTDNDFVNYGISREFIGRMSTIVGIKSLNFNDYINILKFSDLSPLKKYIRLLKKEYNLDLKLPDSIYEKIAKLVIKEDIGARGLEKVVNNIFEPILFELFNQETLNEKEIIKKLIANENEI